MAEAKDVEEKLARARAQLETTLQKRATAEQAVADAQAALQERQAELQSVLSDEGKLRGTILELEKMLQALEVPLRGDSDA